MKRRKHTQKTWGRWLAGSFLAVACLFMTQNAGTIGQMAVGAQLVFLQIGGTKPVMPDQSFQAHMAERLQTRIRKRFGIALPLPTIQTGMEERARLLGRSLSVSFTADDGHAFPSWDIDVSHDPLLVKTVVTPLSLKAVINRDYLATQFRAFAGAAIPLPSFATLESVDDSSAPIRVTSSGAAKFGYAFDVGAAATSVAQALQSSPATTLSFPLRAVKNLIVNHTGRDLGPLTLLATGRSDFSGSGNGRKSNVRKGLGKLSNTLAAPGAVFSYVSVLGPVTPSRGWEMAQAIFPGGVLVYVPGGGICQVATTLFRAVVHGGFPLVEHQNHSLYVHYYEKYGVGLDDTVFPGALDLRFKNDTPNYLLIQTYTEGEEATVNIFGQPDGRKVTLDGPYFSSTAPAEMVVKGNQIEWTQTVRKGTDTVSHPLVSTYKSVPQSLARKYQPAEEVVAE